MKILDDYKMPATFGLVTIFQEHNWATSLQKEDFDLYKNFTYINHSYSHDKKYLLVNPEKDLDKSEMVLKNLFNKIEPIYMYPYGIKSEILILTLKNRNYKMGYGVGSNVVNIKKVNIFNVPRFLINQKVDMPAFIKIVEKSIN